MLRDVVEGQPRGAHRLWLRFEGGDEGEVDLGSWLTFTGVFAPLSDPEYFAQVRVDPELGTIVWPNGADLDPVVLHALPPAILRGTAHSQRLLMHPGTRSHGVGPDPNDGYHLDRVGLQLQP